MSNVFSSLRDELLHTLTTPTPLADGNVHAERARPITSDETEALVIRLTDAEARHAVLCHADWHIDIAIECSARADTSHQAAAAAEALAAQAWARIAPLLGADATPHTAFWQHDAENTPVACITLRAAITRRASDQTLAPAQP